MNNRVECCCTQLLKLVLLLLTGPSSWGRLLSAKLTCTRDRVRVSDGRKPANGKAKLTSVLQHLLYFPVLFEDIVLWTSCNGGLMYT
jgi:hypothetical protein